MLHRVVQAAVVSPSVAPYTPAGHLSRTEGSVRLTVNTDFMAPTVGILGPQSFENENWRANKLLELTGGTLWHRPWDGSDRSGIVCKFCWGQTDTGQARS